MLLQSLCLSKLRNVRGSGPWRSVPLLSSLPCSACCTFVPCSRLMSCPSSSGITLLRGMPWQNVRPWFRKQPRLGTLPEQHRKPPLQQTQTRPAGITCMLQPATCTTRERCSSCCCGSSTSVSVNCKVCIARYAWSPMCMHPTCQIIMLCGGLVAFLVIHGMSCLAMSNIWYTAGKHPNLLHKSGMDGGQLHAQGELDVRIGMQRSLSTIGLS